MPGEALLSDDSTSADEVSVKSDSKSVLAEVMRDLRRAREKKVREASGKEEEEGKGRRVKKTLKEREEERARRQERAAERGKEGGQGAGPVEKGQSAGPAEEGQGGGPVEKGQGGGPVEEGNRSSGQRGEKGEAGETSKREKPDSQIIRAGNSRSSIRTQKKGKDEDEECSSSNSEENLEVRADKKSGQRRKHEQNSRKEGQGAGNISRRVLKSEKEGRRREH